MYPRTRSSLYLTLQLQLHIEKFFCPIPPLYTYCTYMYCMVFGGGMPQSSGRINICVHPVTPLSISLLLRHTSEAIPFLLHCPKPRARTPKQQSLSPNTGGQISSLRSSSREHRRRHHHHVARRASKRRRARVVCISRCLSLVSLKVHFHGSC